MRLKTLKVFGFKTFAESTTLEFNPGITAVVGPNGSGKSNLVDAIRWVLGEQSSRSLRSQRMEDVIFAGNRSRKPLGMAEVSLTFDNADRQLPIDFNDRFAGPDRRDPLLEADRTSRALRRDGRHREISRA